jgi:DNA-directed RNA polymerase specialized sigma24 family protein
MNRDIVAPEDPDATQLAQAVEAGDYAAFHALLADHEDWLRLRVGRWLQRYPDAEAEVGRRVKIGDLVEEVLLNAFEGFHERSDDVPLRDWLNSLIDPSLLDYCRHPAEERENISFVRSLRAPPRTEGETNGQPRRRPRAAKKAARPAAKRVRSTKKTTARKTKTPKAPTAKKAAKSRRRVKAAASKTRKNAATARKKAPRAKKPARKTRRTS